ncbi:hypothetical protein C804_01137 [Lachnospiraceae bacterium A4]|nr:hypothetical protein C804_01137 [Lachnospiraceae bacterium A4]
MLELKYINLKTSYEVEFFQISENIIEIRGDFPVKTHGFTLSRPGQNDDWDYSDFTTIYRILDDSIQFSNDESIYVEPKPEPELPPDISYEPYEPTLSELQESKIREMNNEQQKIIQAGINVALTNGTIEHFTLTSQDQTSLMGLQAQVAQGLDNIPWHTSDQTQHCKYYSNADMSLIVSAAMQYVTWHVTYFRDLRIYIRSLDEKDIVSNIYYGIQIPEKYQSQPLKDMIVLQNNICS